ncbi:glutamate receptor U1-like [Mercenaria mercenaria]|uniref:glutamate receptor U1-like n=1 Tax=Mercenaria mercenaria TaxID=6596 RepID=UPI00234F8AB4|nr:glutamate receptor U1-like [Mercenaria mercenaria]
MRQKDQPSPCMIDVFDIIKKTVLDTQKEYLSINSHEAFKRDFLDMYQKNVQSWDPTSKCNAYHIDTLLWTKNGRQFSSVGYADINGDIVVNSDIFPNAKHGYNQRRFLISTLEYAPFVFKKKVNNSYIYEGFCIDLLEELAHKLNFTYTLTEPDDGNWGTITNEEELTFNGLVGQLQREEVDIVAAPIASQAERSPVMDFSYSYYYEYTTVLVKKPDINATKWRTLLDPFKVEVLVAIGIIRLYMFGKCRQDYRISLLAATVLVFLLEKYNPFYDTPQHKEDRMIQGGLHELHSSFWYVFGALLCQGGVHLPQSTAGRTLISCWWLTCIIIVGTYCGNLIAFLTVTKEKPPFNTLAEMLQLKNTYKWGTVGGTSWEMAFPSSSNPTFRATGKAFLEFSKADPTILHQSPPYHINRVKNDEKYAWIGDKTSIEIAMAKECSLVSIKEEFMPLIYVFGFTNNSPHTAVFSEQMIKIHEGGLYQIWKRKWWPKSNFCAGNSIPEAKPISLMDVQSAFYVCLIGIFLGSIAFLVEYCWYKYSSYRQKRRNYSSSAVLDKQGDRPTDSRKTTTSDHKNRQTHL